MTYMHPASDEALFTAVITEAEAMRRFHIARIFTAARLGNFGILSIGPDTGPFTIPDSPFLAIVGADPKPRGLTPCAFDWPSLKALYAAVKWRGVISTEVREIFYAAACCPPIISAESSLIIECSPDCEAIWVNLTMGLDSTKPTLVCATSTLSPGWAGGKAGPAVH